MENNAGKLFGLFVACAVLLIIVFAFIHQHSNLKQTLDTRALALAAYLRGEPVSHEDAWWLGEREIGGFAGTAGIQTNLKSEYLNVFNYELGLSLTEQTFDDWFADQGVKLFLDYNISRRPQTQPTPPASIMGEVETDESFP